jgi:hypothetical protein
LPSDANKVSQGASLGCLCNPLDHTTCLLLLLLLLLQIRWYDLRYVITTSMACADNFFCPLPVRQHGAAMCMQCSQKNAVQPCGYASQPVCACTAAIGATMQPTCAAQLL